MLYLLKGKNRGQNRVRVTYNPESPQQMKKHFKGDVKKNMTLSTNALKLVPSTLGNLPMHLSSSLLKKECFVACSHFLCLKYLH